MLRPLDVLNLSRATKTLRAILMNRSSIVVWKNARANVARLPECPDDLTEPQYAELVFGKNCFVCVPQKQDDRLTDYNLNLCRRVEKLVTSAAWDSAFAFELVQPAHSKEKSPYTNLGRSHG